MPEPVVRAFGVEGRVVASGPDNRDHVVLVQDEGGWRASVGQSRLR